MISNLKLKTASLRRQHILDAAIRVFETRGFRGATIKDIAKEAGVADGTVYNVFENKEALLLGILEPLLRASQSSGQNQQIQLHSDVTGLLQGMITTRWESQTPETLAMMRIIWSEALTNRELASQYVDKIIGPTLEEPVAYFESLAASGVITATDIPMTMRIIVSSFLGLALLKMLGDPLLESRSDEIPHHLASLLLNGLMPKQAAGDNHGTV
jgi:AcrR family transcriptional regulator